LPLCEISSIRSDESNYKQGLGFVAGGKVLDRGTLKTIFVAVSGALSTVLPVIYALKPGMDDVPSTLSCFPTLTEIALVQATFTNSSCSYDNVTIGELL
jgi:hypothetical protein